MFSEIKLFIGLGNPGEEYQNTRHNAGFIFIDQMKESLNLKDFVLEKEFNAEISKNSIEGKKLILIKPMTFMNRSGDAVIKIMNYFKFNPSEICIIHDDLDIALGEYKIQSAKGPKVHNGIASIETNLNTKDFLRIRIGVDNRTEEEWKNISGADYVLKRLLPGEKEILKKAITQAIDQI